MRDSGQKLAGMTSKKEGLSISNVMKSMKKAKSPVVELEAKIRSL